MLRYMEESTPKKKSMRLFTSPFDLVYLFSGALIAAVGAALFYTPGHITGGGATGVGTIIYYIFGWDQGVVMLFVNACLFLVGAKFFGLMYGLRAFIGSSLLSVLVSVIGGLTQYKGILAYDDRLDMLLSAIYGGVCLGAGVGLVLKSGCNTGGVDIISQIVCAKSNFSFSTLSFIFNAIISIIGGVFMGFETTLFSLIAMYVSAQATNFVLMGFGTNLAKSIYIFSDYHIPEISRRITKDLGRSGTVFHGTGVYTAKTRNLLFVVVPNNQLQQITKIINEEDPTAFVLVQPAYEVLGKGFAKLNKAADKKQ